MSNASLIRFERVALGYGRRRVLREVSLQISQGDFLGIVGPNGSGKTTLLRSILGWIRPQAGKIRRDRRVRFGYVPQRNTIDPLYPLSTLDIVLMGLYAHRPPWLPMRDEDRREARKALERVGLSRQAALLFSELSGGQQQRALLARALVGKPDILVLDEPTNGMDLVSEASVMKIVDEVHRETGMTTLLVTHLLHVVAQHAERIGLIQEDRIVVGETGKMLTSEHLSRLYGTDIRVHSVDGKTVVIAP